MRIGFHLAISEDSYRGAMFWNLFITREGDNVYRFGEIRVQIHTLEFLHMGLHIMPNDIEAFLRTGAQPWASTP